MNIDASQKKIDNGSIVIRNAPMLKIGVVLTASTAQSPASALNNRRAMSLRAVCSVQPLVSGR